MTRTFQTDATNDLVLDARGDLSVVDGAQAVAGNCKTAVQAQLGEMMFAADKGMPTFDTAWNHYNPVQFEAAARTILSRVEGVVSVDSFTIQRSGETLGYTATIRTIYGGVTVNG